MLTTVEGDEIDWDPDLLRLLPVTLPPVTAGQ